MKIEVRVPTLSDSVASGTLLPWRKQLGEMVARDETLVDLETDKVIMEIPAPASGTLVELRQAEGAVVKADEVVAVIETGEQAGRSPAPSQTGTACRCAACYDQGSNALARTQPQSNAFANAQAQPAASR